MHHLRTQTRKLEYFIVRHLIEFSRKRDLSWISRIDSINVGKNVTPVCLHNCSQSHSRCIRTTASQSGNVFIRIDTLKPSDNDDCAFVQFFLYTMSVDIPDARLG